MKPGTWLQLNVLVLFFLTSATVLLVNSSLPFNSFYPSSLYGESDSWLLLPGSWSSASASTRDLFYRYFFFCSITLISSRSFSFKFLRPVYPLILLITNKPFVLFTAFYKRLAISLLTTGISLIFSLLIFLPLVLYFLGPPSWVTVCQGVYSSCFSVSNVETLFIIFFY